MRKYSHISKELFFMSLRLIIEGSSESVSEFMEYLRTSTPRYRFYDQSKLATTPTESRVEYYFDKNRFLKPQVSKKVSKLKLTTMDNNSIELTLLNAKIINMVDGSTYIQGTSFEPTEVDEHGM
jgi:hypothetical protein